MKRVTVCIAIGIISLVLATVRYHPEEPGAQLSEALQKSTYASVARVQSAKAGLLAAGWSKVDLPIAKLAHDNNPGRTAREELVPRLSVLLIGRPTQPQLALITLETLAIPDRLDRVLRAYAGEVLNMPP